MQPVGSVHAQIRVHTAGSTRFQIKGNYMVFSVPQTHPQNPGKDSWVGESQNVCLLEGREMIE